MRRLSTVAVALLLATTAARAQDQTGTAAPAAGQDASVVQKAQRWAEDWRLAERLAPEEGFYVRFGGMTTGSGLALGPGYRTSVLGDRVFTDVSAALSTKLYKAVDVKARWARVLDDRVEIWTDFLYRDYPEEDFFGIGGDSSLAGRTSYGFESLDAVGRLLVHVTPWLSTGANLGYLSPRIEAGGDDDLPSIEQLFTVTEAPGLRVQPDFLHTTFFADVDYRDRKGQPTRGGRYRASFGTWRDVSLDAYDHHRFDADAAQFLPVTPRQVVALHVGLSYVNNETGHDVPFYFLPYIGGSDTVRGFREFRFRDENILFLNAEYRIQVWPFLQVAPFVDAGEVRADWQDIGPGDLKTSYGIGIRAGTRDQTFVRLDIGTGGREGTRVFFKFGPAF